MRRYIEEYSYDKVGNLLEFYHEGVGGPSSATWTRTYRYDTGVTSGYESNRLHSTSEPGPAWASYTHDANGNMVSMPHLATIEYTHRDQMRHADLGGGGDAYYTYDAGGERVRKFIQRAGTTTEEHIYLGGWELYRKRVGTAQDIEIERETLHVMDDARRIAMVETLTIEDEDPVATIVPRIRYQYGNHLDSAMLECDQEGDVISYEEYHPYGTAAYRSAKSGVEVSEKRYRYTGKERDEETGFGYHQWRYYAPWLARWTTADPIGIADGVNPLAYCQGNPVLRSDSNGTDSTPMGRNPLWYLIRHLFGVKRSSDTNTAPTESAASENAEKTSPPAAEAAPSNPVADEVLQELARTLEETSPWMPTGDVQPGPTGGGPLPGENPSCPSRGCHLARHGSMTRPSGSGPTPAGSGPGTGQAWSQGGKGDGKTPAPAGTPPVKPPAPSATQATGGASTAPAPPKAAAPGGGSLPSKPSASPNPARAQPTGVAAPQPGSGAQAPQPATGPSGSTSQPNSPRGQLTDLMRQRERQLELGADAAHGGKVNAVQGAAGVRMENALGRKIQPGTHAGVDFVDQVLGPISLKGPLPPAGKVEGLISSAVKDLSHNTATKALFVDLSGLSAADAARVQTAVEAAAAGASKKVFFLR